MTSLLEIAVVTALILGALAFLGRKAYRRVTSQTTACGGCGGACGGTEPTVGASGEGARPGTQIQATINLLTPITAEDRGR